ncbi:YcxB family protein [Flavobacterium sp.]|uniref:YcxB family protein n=1 Tax=Flavobacterium sp. TaxID=239 RepID=UPI0011FF650D|nr:YcxB family protein [Flavobacterium sp.]RZJ68976.1 MAG: hypothetical protein EOO49_18930 [Flavobacterium sp.]
MHFQIVYNEAKYRRKSHVIFDKMWEKSRKNVVRSLVSAIVLLGLGIAIVVGKSSLGLLLIGFGALYIFVLLKNASLYKQRKKAMDLGISRAKAKMKPEDAITTISFSDEFLLTQNASSEHKLSWKYFDYYLETENVLYLVGGSVTGFAFSFDEVGAETYSQIKDFLDSKLQKRDRIG